MFKYALISALLLVSLTVNADIYKCVAADNKVGYQPAPCSAADAEQKLAIKKPDPVQEALRRGRLEEWQDNRRMYERELNRAQKEYDEIAARNNTVKALQNNADAQYQQAYQLRREADAQVERNRLEAGRAKNRPLLLPVAPSYYRY
jgi:hypothetical protein